MFSKIQKLVTKIFLAVLLNLVFRNSRDSKKFRNKLKNLGSNYGGWTYLDIGLDNHSHILSFGVGEDISFDTEIAEKYGCIIRMFDPTPRSIQHMEDVYANLGHFRTCDYTNDGNQPVAAYNLKRIKKRQLVFVEKAVWLLNGSVKFFQPPNPEHVSHSITGYNQGDLSKASFIEVPCVDVLDLFNNKVDLVKLDIEGAEIPVLNRVFDKITPEKLPKQILVEFDELQLPKFKNFLSTYYFHNSIVKKGYSLVSRNGYNFTYVDLNNYSKR